MGLEQDILNVAPEMLSVKRWHHCLRTAEFACLLAEKFSSDEEVVRLAALAHDLAREQPESLILEWALLDQLELSEYSRSHPVLLHGFASSWILRRDFGVTDASLLNAVRFHTTGHPQMNREGMVVFAADYMEPGRKHLSDSERNSLMDLSLEDLVATILESMEKYLKSRNEELSQESRELYLKLKKRYNEGP